MAILIRNAIIFDGLKYLKNKSDLLINNGLILRIGKVGRLKSARIINAAGCIVCPGFIDPAASIEQHSYINAETLRAYFLRQGITSVVTSSGGVSRAPATLTSLHLLSEHGIIGNEGLAFLRVRDYLRFLAAGKLPLNVGTYVGYETLRESFTPSASRSLSVKELNLLKSQLGAALKEGAFGASLNLNAAESMRMDQHEESMLADTLNELGAPLVLEVSQYPDNHVQLTLIQKKFASYRIKVDRLIIIDASQGLPPNLSAENTSARSNETALVAVYGKLAVYNAPELLPAVLRSRSRTESLLALANEHNHSVLFKHFETLPIDTMAIGNPPEVYSILRGKKLSDVAQSLSLDLPHALRSLLLLFDLQGSFVFQRKLPSSSWTSIIPSAGRLFQIQSLRKELVLRDLLKDSLIAGPSKQSEHLLKNLTSETAKLLGLKHLGTLQPGSRADCVILKKGEVSQVFVNGVLSFDLKSDITASAGHALASQFRTHEKQ